MTADKPRKPIYPIQSLISDIDTTCLRRQSTLSRTSDTARHRFIIVGDVHGMRRSLQKLLAKVEFDNTQGDHLILVGDMTNKGPDSAGVVDLAIQLEASAVRGNHDNAVLDAAAELAVASGDHSQVAALKTSPALPDAPLSEEQTESHLPKGLDGAEPVSKSPLTRHGETTYRTASQLSVSQREWLAKLPLMLRLSLPLDRQSTLGHNLVIVHAGLVPGVALEKQDPYNIIHMRSLKRIEGDDGSRFEPLEEFGEEGWAAEWDRWQERCETRSTVIFGHDAKRRLQLGNYSIGLDSACLYGFQLSALVIIISEREICHEIVQVDCEDIPVPPKMTEDKDKQTAADKQ
ncbi:Ser-Thr protein phosphatase family protein [Penicillium ucsense]|uniref:Ser/Thr protein phosphatase family protein n=1 Tax=Penicillium ucsense TaxID=2839758 RepID=A0A8J8WDE0_9EURO|nr:Ser/Thr protein phosphatase family protein [Penicillium ucsense]KAF7729706.1 Ser-Thr protein phosphatase family protein [Penicillium ucsense]